MFFANAKFLFGLAFRFFDSLMPRVGDVVSFGAIPEERYTGFILDNLDPSGGEFLSDGDRPVWRAVLDR